MNRFFLSFLVVGFLTSCKPTEVSSESHAASSEGVSVEVPSKDSELQAEKEKEQEQEQGQETQELSFEAVVERESLEELPGEADAQMKLSESDGSLQEMQKMIWQSLDLPTSIPSSESIPANGKKRVLLLESIIATGNTGSQATGMGTKSEQSSASALSQSLDAGSSGSALAATARAFGYATPMVASGGGDGFQYHPYLLSDSGWWQQPLLKFLPMSQKEIMIISTWAPSVQDSDLENLLHEAHESLEGAHPMESGLRGKWKEWVQNFNIHDFVLNGYRWIQMKKMDPRFKNDALNVAFLFGVSHGLETMAGPTALMWAQHAGAGPAEMGLIGTAGFMISIPGFDPLCMVLASFYKTNDQFRRVITQLRVVTVKSVTGFSNLSGVSTVLDRAFALRPAKERLNEWLQQRHLSAAQIKDHSSGNSLELLPGAKILFENHENQILVKEFILDSSVAQDSELPKKLKKATSELGYSFSISFSETLEYLKNKRSKPFFIQKKEVLQTQTHIHFEKGAVFIRPQLVFRKSPGLARIESKCNQLF
jgi:hypothetical protein